MRTCLLLFLPSSLAFAALPTTDLPRVAQTQQRDIDARIERCGEDAAALFRLSDEYREARDWTAQRRVLDRVVEMVHKRLEPQVETLLAQAAQCLEAKDRAGAKGLYARVIDLDADNATARRGLRHQKYDGMWFTDAVELSDYKLWKAVKIRGTGPVESVREWEAPDADTAFEQMGWEKQWINPVDAERSREVERLKQVGYAYRADDNSWVAPADFDKWAGSVKRSGDEWVPLEEGDQSPGQLFKCGGKWHPLEEADKYHATYETMWQIAGERYVVLTTREWATGNRARWHADQTYPELVRIFGVEPAGKPEVAVLRNLREYNETAGTRGIFSESEGFSSIHGAYFADLSFDASTAPPQYRGCGVTYWDTESAIGAWGPMWIRWAAAQSYIDAIDRSWGAIGNYVASGGQGEPDVFGNDFWREKKIPRWLRYGAATYVERFTKDPTAGDGEDADRLRRFALNDIQKNGGMHPLEEILAFQITINDLDNSSRLYREAGLVVDFLLDGAREGWSSVSPLTALPAALQDGDDHASRLRATRDLVEQLHRGGVWNEELAAFHERIGPRLEHYQASVEAEVRARASEASPRKLESAEREVNASQAKLSEALASLQDWVAVEDGAREVAARRRVAFDTIPTPSEALSSNDDGARNAARESMILAVYALGPVDDEFDGLRRTLMTCLRAEGSGTARSIQEAYDALERASTDRRGASGRRAIAFLAFREALASGRSDATRDAAAALEDVLRAQSDTFAWFAAR